jgi:hypothetical protein
MRAERMHRQRGAHNLRPASEAGVTIVEVLVAALLLVLGALSTMAMVDASHRQTFRAEQSQVVNDRLQVELEAAKRLDYADIELASAPIPSPDPDSPNHRVGSAGGQPVFAMNENGTDVVPLVIDEGETDDDVAAINPGPEPFASGDVTGNIYRYVTWVNDLSCPPALCPGAEDFKRVTIVAQVDSTAAGGERTYQEIQSDVVDGNLKQENGGNPGTPATAEPVAYHLSDTPCDQSAAAPPSSHLAHNTLGACSAGMQTGTTPGAPDRMFRESLTDTVGEFDLSLDVLTAQPADVGLQVPVQPKECDYAPLRAAAPLQVHRWVTAPVTGTENFVLDGSATLAIWSRTINDAAHSGRLCMWLFTREPTVAGGEADNLIPDPSTGASYFVYSEPNWSSSSWSRYSIPIQFEELALQPGDRLGLAIAVTPPERRARRSSSPMTFTALRLGMKCATVC